jgi:hypothetical protein
MKFRSSLLLILAIFSVLSMTSCVKKYTCSCLIKYSGAPGMPDSVYNEYDVYNNKKGAESVCKKESYEKEENGVKITETCKLY